MDCKKVKSLLSAYIDQELNPSLEKEVRAHLEECLACKREVEELRKTISQVKSLPKMEVPEGFPRKVQQRIAETSPSPKSPLLRLSLPAVATAAVIILAVIIAKQFTPGEGILPLESMGPAERLEERIDVKDIGLETREKFTEEVPEVGDKLGYLEQEEEGKEISAASVPKAAIAGKKPGTKAEADEKQYKVGESLKLRGEKVQKEEGKLEDVVVGEDLGATMEVNGISDQREDFTLAEELSSELEPTEVAKTKVAVRAKAKKKTLPQWKGFYSTHQKEAQLVIREEKEWKELWSKVGFTRIAPLVDFSQYMVVAVFMGEKPTGGYQIEIINIEEKMDHLLVYYKEVTPPKGAIVTQAFTQPYHLKVIPKSPREVKFQKIE